MRPSFSHLPHGEPVPVGLSPAARALILELGDHDTQSDVPAPHLANLTKRGLTEVLEELVRARVALVLEHGHVIATTTFLRYLSMLDALSPGFRSRDAADLWRCSHGRARATLARMVRDGFVERRESVFSLPEVHGDR